MTQNHRPMVVGKCVQRESVKGTEGEPVKPPAGSRAALTEGGLMMIMMKLPILPCAEKLELVLSTAPRT